MSSLTALIAALAGLAPAAFACDVVVLGRTRVDVAMELVRTSEVIVRATVAGYTVPPGDSQRVGSIRFQIEETIRGQKLPELSLPGELVAQDDFNVHPSPYQVVRSNGLAGTCYAWQYRIGGQYLLMLKKADTGEWTVNWYPLAPVNEQLHSAGDPWAVWVRAQVRKGRIAGHVP